MTKVKVFGQIIREKIGYGTNTIDLQKWNCHQTWRVLTFT